MAAPRILFGVASLVASGVAYAEPTLEVDGVCPAITVTLTDATPNRQVMLFTGDPSATTTLAGGSCAGTTIDLADANERRHRLVTARTDSAGALDFTPASVAASDCAAGSVQGIDLTTCEVTDAVSLQLDCSTLDDALVGYWPGDDDLHDVVGSHPTMREGRVDYAPGVVGDAFEFNGRSAIKIAPADDLEHDEGEPFTYAMWVYNEGTQPYHLFGKRHTCGPGGTFDYQLVVENNRTAFGPDGCRAEAPSVPPADTWQHVVAVYDGSAFSVYLDGELGDSSAACGSDVMAGFGAEIRIGSSGTCGTLNNQGWVGLVDDVKIWDRALTEQEIVCVSSPE